MPQQALRLEALVGAQHRWAQQREMKRGTQSTSPTTAKPTTGAQTAAMPR